MFIIVTSEENEDIDQVAEKQISNREHDMVPGT